jgi:hypothetical protein
MTPLAFAHGSAQKLPQSGLVQQTIRRNHSVINCGMLPYILHATVF